MLIWKKNHKVFQKLFCKNYTDFSTTTIFFFLEMLMMLHLYIKYELNYKNVLYIYINHFTSVTISTTIIWCIPTYCAQASCLQEVQGCKLIWGADQENISIQQYTYMFFQAMCIRVEIPLNSHTNLLQMQMCHECHKFTPASCRLSVHFDHLWRKAGPLDI